MTRQELEDKITKLAKLDGNPNVPQAFQDDAKAQIKILKAQLVALDAPLPTPSVVEPPKPTPAPSQPVKTEKTADEKAAFAKKMADAKAAKKEAEPKFEIDSLVFQKEKNLKKLDYGVEYNGDYFYIANSDDVEMYLLPETKERKASYHFINRKVEKDGKPTHEKGKADTLLAAFTSLKKVYVDFYMPKAPTKPQPVKKEATPKVTTQKPMYAIGDIVTVKDGDYKGDKYKITDSQLDKNTYLYNLSGEVPLKNISESRIKEWVAPKAPKSNEKPFANGEYVIWHGSPAVVASSKPHDTGIFDYEIFDGAKLQKAYHGDLESADGQLEVLGVGNIKCDFLMVRNTSGKKMSINNVNGNLTIAPNDVILILPENHHSFTVIKDDSFHKRCLITKESSDPTPPTLSEPKIEKMVEASNVTPKVKRDKVAKKAQKATKPEPGINDPKIKERVNTLADTMVKEGCNIAHFVKETKGTPIHDYLLGMVEDLNDGDTEEKVARIGIDKEGRYIAETEDTSGILTTIFRYYQVCPDRGIATELKAEAKTLHDAFNDRKLRVQFSKEKVRKIYNYGSSFETCTNLAHEAYKGGSSEKHKKFRQTCLNPVLIDFYKERNKAVHRVAKNLRKKDTSLSHYEAARLVRKQMKSRYRLHDKRSRTVSED